MPDLNDFSLMIKALKAEIVTETARKIADDMHAETMRNFDEEAYTNDGGSAPWPDRPYEGLLGYKKLDYTGRMKRSIKPMRRREGRSAIAGVKAGVDYAEMHNKGGFAYSRLQNRRSGNRTLTTGEKVNISSFTVRKRKFMGIGSKTVAQAKRRIDETMSKYFRS